ncbi:MAG: UDP-N-acetylmuramate--L-alanine ligase, partial [Ferruginibacter sp.]
MTSLNKTIAALLPLPEMVKGSAVYFLGIGGIGMSALARYFNKLGIQVSGYDKTATPLTDQLKKEGIEIHFDDDINLLNKDAQLVVYTPAIPADQKQLNFYRNNKYPLFKRSEVLAMITEGSYSICVAGTHGKTTTSAMLAHILKHTGYGSTAFLGGIATNYDTNFWNHTNNVSIVEADEYDRSFLQLAPDLAIVTAMDEDHLDIYGTAQNMEDAFIDFTKKIKKDGLLIYKQGLARTNDLVADNKMSYSVKDEAADATAQNIAASNGSYYFDVQLKNTAIKDVQLNMGGRHNIENAVACIAAANHLNINHAKIVNAIASFKGVKRRFEKVLEGDHIVIDDYAHHPEELNALLSGVKEMYPDKKCVVVFQPHLFSRTKDLA